jgi:hypothetical protein
MIRRSKPLYAILAIIYGVFCLSLLFNLISGNGNVASFIFAVILGGASFLCIRTARGQSPDSQTRIG